MKRIPLFVLMIAFAISTLSLRHADEWTPLLDKNLPGWETYLSYNHTEGYDGNIPKDKSGNPIAPIGYNNDKNKVFSLINQNGEDVLRISGTTYGAIFTKNIYENYHLKLKVKWGQTKSDPRKNKLKDSGILYHSNGEAGAEYWRSWMLSQEFQIMEGHMGDFWSQANGIIDIKAYPSEGMMNRVADINAPWGTSKKGTDPFCMRSANFESPNNDWTTLELICFEGKSLHIVNGNVVMALKNSRYLDTDGQEKPMHKGKIQLQSEGAEVFYKDIYIRQIQALPKEYKSLFN